MRPFFFLLVPLLASAGGSVPAAVCGAPVAGTAEAFVVVERAAPADPPDSLATITVCLVSDTTRLRVAGYHGELSFGAGAKVVRVEHPPGGTRLENPNLPGRVAFAGVAAQGFPQGALVSVTVTGAAREDDRRLRLAMLDVTDVDGRDAVRLVHVDSLPRTTPPHASPKP